MSNENDDYIYDDATGEWRPASENAASEPQSIEVRDASGTVLADGDAVVLIKDLKVKGAGQTLIRWWRRTIPRRAPRWRVPSA